MARIPLRRRDGTVRAYALVDDADLSLVAPYRWYLSHGGYAVRETHPDPATPKYRIQVFVHRSVMGLQPGDVQIADHINGDRLDNRRSNLRLASAEVNAQNRLPNRRSMSGVRGVGWHARLGKWQASTHVNGRTIYLGVYETKEEAGAVAAAARAERMAGSREALQAELQRAAA